MLQTAREVPHAVAVSIDEMSDREDLAVIKATVHVEKAGQRKILVGNGGHQIRDIGQAARERIERLLGKRVFLELFVRITPRWKNMPRQLAELGYEPAPTESGSR
jgi:GTP-binding protein Era